jgi:hypothetical protein
MAPATRPPLRLLRQLAVANLRRQIDMAADAGLLVARGIDPAAAIRAAFR